MRIPSALHATRGRSVLAALLAVVLIATAACGEDSSPTVEEPTPTGPLEGQVLADVSGELPASLAARDTVEVVVPAGTMLGLIFESPRPIAAIAGGIRWSPGGTFAVVTEIEGPALINVRLGHGNTDEEPSEPLPYRVRAIAVRDAPEHAAVEVPLGQTLIDEWVDLPLDVDVFRVHLENGDRFFIESESDGGRAVTMRVQTPGGAGYFAFTATGPELAASEVFEAHVSGEYLLTVYAEGVEPDVATLYRFRVLRTALD